MLRERILLFVLEEEGADDGEDGEYVLVEPAEAGQQQLQVGTQSTGPQSNGAPGGGSADGTAGPRDQRKSAQLFDLNYHMNEVSGGSDRRSNNVYVKNRKTGVGMARDSLQADFAGAAEE